MDSIREKIIELLCNSPKAEPPEGVKTGVDIYSVSKVADHLIANGVTINRGTDDTSVAYNLSPTNKWIPVKERLPESQKRVLAVCKSGKIFVGEFVDLGWRTLWRIRTARDSTKEITQIVTHWMPLPEPPKGD